jgi:EAL domain-containing protein (putative c-di-GMP-specific phosphodiesterase class I)
MGEEAAPGAPGATESVIDTELATALGAHEFFLVYQPAFDLQSGAFSGVEALIRWRHPSRGVLGPDQFLSELTGGDQASAIGRWTLETACRQGALWHRKGYRFPVSINVARRHFASPRFADDVRGALAAGRMAPSQLILEFSQALILDLRKETLTRVEALTDSGVRLAVDDFDVTSSSLDVIAATSVSIVKLSRDSLASLVTSDSGGRRLHELVANARARGVQVVASGVEDAVQREFLSAEPVDLGQGFLFSRPYEVTDIDRLLEDYALFSGKPL